MGFKDESTVSSKPTTAVVLLIRVMIELMLLVDVGLPALDHCSTRASRFLARDSLQLHTISSTEKGAVRSECCVTE